MIFRHTWIKKTHSDSRDKSRIFRGCESENNISIVKHGGGNVMVWSYFTTSGPGSLTVVKTGDLLSVLWEKTLHLCEHQTEDVLKTSHTQKWGHDLRKTAKQRLCSSLVKFWTWIMFLWQQKKIFFVLFCFFQWFIIRQRWVNWHCLYYGGPEIQITSTNHSMEKHIMDQKCN